MGDNGGGPKAMVWMLGHGLNGHINTTCDMWPGSPAGIHFGFLMPWSQHNNWASCQQPWLLGEEGLRIFRKYAKLRYSLLPYIYSTAHIGCRSGMPIMRAMPLVYPNDAACENLTTQYMLGDFLLSAVYTDTLYLPEGKWIDYWTGNVYQGPVNMKIEYPKDCGGALFVKSGAILPMWPPTDHVRGKQFETILLDIYPGGNSQFTLYEDDGVSLDYTKGGVATTTITCQENNSEIRIEIQPRKGTYDAMPKERIYDVRLHVLKPKKVLVDGNDCMAEGADLFNPETSILHLRVRENSVSDKPVIILVGQ
jgi:alpha-glucosidase (family GH31 glycosyl hydrolase)